MRPLFIDTGCLLALELAILIRVWGNEKADTMETEL